MTKEDKTIALDSLRLEIKATEIRIREHKSSSLKSPVLENHLKRLNHARKALQHVETSD
jgi:hypothetical protein